MSSCSIEHHRIGTPPGSPSPASSGDDGWSDYCPSLSELGSDSAVPDSPKQSSATLSNSDTAARLQAEKCGRLMVSDRGRADSDCMDFWLERCDKAEEDALLDDVLLETLKVEKETVRNSIIQASKEALKVEDRSVSMATTSCSTATPYEVKVANYDEPSSPLFMSPRDGRTPRQLLEASRFMCDSSMVPQERRLGDSHGSGSGLPPTPELGVSLGQESGTAMFTEELPPDWSLVAREGCMRFVERRSGRTLPWATPPPSLLEAFGGWRQEAARDDKLWWYNSRLDGYLEKDPSSVQSVYQAALDGNYFFVEAYRQVGGSLDMPDTVSRRTPLHYACAGGCAYTVQLLLRYIDSAFPVDTFGQTPLHFACRYGYAVVTAVLLGACRRDEVLLVDHAGCTALHEASTLGQADCVVEILARLESPVLAELLRVRDQRGYTCLEAAAVSGHEDVLELLTMRMGAIGAPVPPDIGSGEKSSEVLRPMRHHYSEQELVQSEDEEWDEETGRPLDPDEPRGLTDAVRPLFTAVQRKLFPTRAHLGSENKFVFDRRRGQWVLPDPPRAQYRFPGSGRSST
ncbi:hypothetical protein FOZ62_029376 [Perkinsus olseni]|uniref:Uncharacterized protein n=1 Tax=Perkinsus olseni TaxID=32597 RepID=A0A7J6U850_PEROL|nr:hypothetical protein FOZ62_029376 [Perkinsus olseni]